MSDNPYLKVISTLNIPVQQQLCLIVMAKYAYKNGGLGNRMFTHEISAATGLAKKQVLDAMFYAFKRRLLICDGYIYGEKPECSSHYTLNIKAEF